ncbi:MAG: response regulator [Pseudomonadota bacterium]
MDAKRADHLHFGHQLPLIGITILLVEDSRFYSEAVRLLSLRSGARLRRADSIKAAERHLAVYRPDVLIVDLGLPDGVGTDVIEMAQGLDQRPAILATSGAVENGAELAREAGADLFLAKPMADLSAFQQVILRLCRDQSAGARRSLGVVGTTVMADRKSLVEDLERATGLLDRDPIYAAQFILSVAEAAEAHDLAQAARTAVDLGDDDALRVALQKQLTEEGAPV